MTLTRDDPVTAPARFRPRPPGGLAPSGEVGRVKSEHGRPTGAARCSRQGRPAPQGAGGRSPAGQGGARSRVSTRTATSSPAEREELRRCCPRTEMRRRARTTINAHYTDPAYVAGIWAAVAALGFSGGQVLEPGCGVGNFIGMAPASAKMTGVELDPITAAIAPRCTRTRDPHRVLRRHPPAKASSTCDRQRPVRRTRGCTTARTTAAGHSMHNHFIIKSLELTAPGGLVAVLTSRYTLDARNPAARREINQLADLSARVRLPSGAHRRAAGTDASPTC